MNGHEACVCVCVFLNASKCAFVCEWNTTGPVVTRKYTDGSAHTHAFTRGIHDWSAKDTTTRCGRFFRDRGHNRYDTSALSTTRRDTHVFIPRLYTFVAQIKNKNLPSVFLLILVFCVFGSKNKLALFDVLADMCTVDNIRIAELAG